MKKTQKLENQELCSVSGGGWGYNKYPKDTYHDAGFITLWSKRLISEDHFWLRLDGYCKTGPTMNEKEANEFTDYFTSHTADEYLAYVNEKFPGVTKIYRGFDNG